MTKSSKKREAKRMKRAAAKAPTWLRTGAAATYDPNGDRVYRKRRLGTFGAASPVRQIDPAAYAKGKDDPT